MQPRRLSQSVPRKTVCGVPSAQCQPIPEADVMKRAEVGRSVAGRLAGLALLAGPPYSGTRAATKVSRNCRRGPLAEAVSRWVPGGAILLPAAYAGGRLGASPS